SDKKFRKLTRHLLARIKESSAITNKLQINDQLYQLYYNNYVVYDRGKKKTKVSKKDADFSYKPGGANNQLSMRSQSKMINIDMNDLTITEAEREKELIESDKEERVYYEEVLEDGNNKPLDDVNSLIENNTESISKVKGKGKLTNKGIEPKELSQIVEENNVSKDDCNIQSIELIHDQFRILYDHQREKNSPIFDVQTFIETIESREPKLKGLFNAFFLAMNLEGKNQQTKELLYKKVMLLCYQMARLRNKQISN
ncbi:17437_t:CDS:2, partial [Racocetra fulgida]